MVRLSLGLKTHCKLTYTITFHQLNHSHLMATTGIRIIYDNDRIKLVEYPTFLCISIGSRVMIAWLPEKSPDSILSTVDRFEQWWREIPDHDPESERLQSEAITNLFPSRF